MKPRPDSWYVYLFARVACTAYLLAAKAILGPPTRRNGA
jgi:hypothetical protein